MLRKFYQRAVEELRVDLTPEKLKAFAKLGRYHNQIGTKLLFWPCAWGVALGASNPFSIATLGALGLFYFGAFNLRSAGSAVNDILDRKFDSEVERTKIRPIASGELTVPEASKFVAAHLAGGLLTLTMMKGVAIKQSLLIFPLAMAYPLSKRYTNYAQVVLGLCFNSGIFIGFAQASGIGLIAPLLPFYVGGILWTIMYDTVYALQDIDGDRKLKLKGMALLWGKRTKLNCHRANLMMLASFLYGGYLFDLNMFYHLGMVVNSIIYSRWIDEINYKDPKTFHQFFMRNALTGMTIFFLILIGRIGMNKGQGKSGERSTTSVDNTTTTSKTG